FLYEAQPVKFAAMEGVFVTQRGAPLTIAGIPVESQGRVVGGVEIPRGLSFLANFDFDSEVKGLDTVRPEDRPNPVLVHLSFDTMVGLSLLSGAAALLFWLLAWRRRTVPTGRWLLRALVLAGPATVVAMEAGWFVTEFGRQPWVVYGVLRTADAATTSPGVGP